VYLGTVLEKKGVLLFVGYPDEEKLILINMKALDSWIFELAALDPRSGILLNTSKTLMAFPYLWAVLHQKVDCSGLQNKSIF